MFACFILFFVGIVVPMSSLNVLDMFPEFGNLKNTVTTNQQSIQSHQQSITTLSAAKPPPQAIYTRWGRRDCYNAQVLYEGQVAGGWWEHAGSAANYLCLVKDPYFTGKKIHRHDYQAGIWGAEYEDNVFAHNYQNYDVPCAVCVASPATSVVMIPGKKDCPAGMQYRYWGLLATGANNGNAAGEYICMDYIPQNSGSITNSDGVQMLPVQARCGSLSCPPYKEDELVTCVVCTK